MEYRIVVDSCGELTDEMKKSGIYKTASLSMEVDGVHIQDDESFDQADFLKRVAESLEESYMKKSMAGNRSMSLIQDQHRSENL